MLPQFSSTRQEFTAEINHTRVFGAWQRLTKSYGSPAAVGPLYTPFVESWIGYAAWPVAAIVLAAIVVRLRDV